MTAIENAAALPEPDSRWAADPYPDYVREVNHSIAFSGAEQSFFTRGKAQRALEVLRRRGSEPRDMNILDIGCGVGLMHPYMSGEFGRVVGCDLALDALRSAGRANPSVEYREQIGAGLPAANGEFDAAMTVCVMHHVPPPQWSSFLSEAKAALKPGGWFMVFEHNPWNPLTRLAVARCPFDFDAVLINPFRMTRMLREAGFVEVAREFIFFSPFDVPLIKQAEEKLRWLPAGAQYVAIGRRPI